MNASWLVCWMLGFNKVTVYVIRLIARAVHTCNYIHSLATLKGTDSIVLPESLGIKFMHI